jgi:alkyl hydroperoxide reductase subunit AhpF
VISSLDAGSLALAAARTGLQALLAASGGEAREWVAVDGSPLGLDLPYGRIDGPAFAAAMPLALERAGVERLQGRALALESPSGSPWQVRLAGGAVLESEAVLLAAGAASALLWPPLAPGLATSWAGVLALAKDTIAASGQPQGGPTQS